MYRRPAFFFLVLRTALVYVFLGHPLCWPSVGPPWSRHRRSTAIDDVYREKEMQENDDAKEDWPDLLPLEEYHRQWHGLRVRVGMHYGMGDIKLDPVSFGYDYYGTVVNTAARVESACHGGQIGTTQEVFNALKGRLPGVHWTDLGLQPLRGLSEPIHIFQALPSGPLSSRRCVCWGGWA